MQIDTRDADWYAGLSLLERHAVLPDSPPAEGPSTEPDDDDEDDRVPAHAASRSPGSSGSPGSPPSPASPSAATSPDAAYRWQRWRRQSPLAQPALFGQRLAADGLTEDRLHQLLHAPVDMVMRACDEPPDWLQMLSHAVDGPGQRRPISAPPIVREACTGFLAIVEPLVTQAYALFQAQVMSTLRDCANVPCTPQAIQRLFFDGLDQQLLALISRTLVLELNVARMRGDLHGSTPAERFADFTSRLREPEVAARIFKEYPVLVRIVLDSLDARVSFQVRLLRDLCDDWRAITSTWPALATATLRKVSTSLGDTHRGGRAVVRVSFAPEGELIYKPKSLAIDRHMQLLLRWLNERGARHGFRTTRLVDCGEHGWVELVAHEACHTPAQVTRFYERLGGLLALLYVLEATDFHYENVIACGEHPVLVDLEALFHARGQMTRDDSAQAKATESLAQSVVRVGLLPQRVWSAGGSDGIDLSGLGGEPGQRLPQRIPGWEAAGTDEMRLVDQEATLPGARNRPSLRGQPVDVLAEARAIERGFVEMYQLLRWQRDALLEESGPLRTCAHDEVRTILRPTRVYTWLLQERVHPDVLRNGLDQDRLLDWLWIDAERQPPLTRVVTTERDDLRRGDVPYFTTTPSSRAIWTSAGVEIPDFHQRSGMDSVEQRLRELSDADLDRQRWFLRASLASLAPAEERIADVPLTGPPVAPAPQQAFLEAARLVGDRLEQLAFRTDTEASWIGMTLLAEQHWSLVPLGVDLYGGLPGVALFLARLGSVTGENKYDELARQAITSVLRQLDAQQPWPLVGAFAGWGGVIYTLTHVGLLLRDPVLIERAERLVPHLQSAIAGDTHFDLVSGSAGAIMGLSALHAVTGSAPALAAICVAAERLVAAARPLEVGVGWRTSLNAEAPLVGCSHGAAGIALALLTAWSWTADARFEQTARAAMAYERSTFSEDAGNWPDFRVPVSTSLSGSTSAPASVRGSAGSTSTNTKSRALQQTFLTTWCHGAPGIGLARLAGLRYADDSSIRDDIARAVHTTLRYGFGRNHSLCHGDLGNLELLASAAARVNEPGLRSSVACFAAGILRSIREHGWRCGVPLQVETPGLMMGLAGIGDGLLRIAEPSLPSILMLQAP
jgi:type 2 lantibiotic biosynthesis protein LanM